MTFSLFSQNNVKKDTLNRAKNTVYYEFFGISGSPYSLQYDRVIYQAPSYYINVSGGFGFYNYGGSKKYSFPFSINSTTGKKNNHFEFGLAFIYKNEENQKYTNPNVIFFGPKLGYKYQKRHGSGVFVKSGVNFMLGTIHLQSKKTDCGLFGCDFLDNLFYLLGVSVGYSF